MFYDNDSVAQNSHIIYEILNDTLQILKPNCTAFEVDHEGLKASAINCSMLIIYFRL